mmetsp:Transcript_26664/g.59811  ORF Transcript_26664/g.59811 Transcript_26664/m.59811 type:complete len:179 (+) Transcript_26664:98-634(+)
MNRLVSSRAVRSMVTRCSSASRGGTSAATRPLVSSFASTVRLPLVPHQRRCLSSHDDFAPKKKHGVDGGDDDAVLGMIDSHVKGNRVMLYMKGSPNQPMCGFSATVVGILKNSGADFASVNVLDYPEIREGVKKYAQWPTIPQLYVDSEFVGGCDIIKDLHDSGELKEMLKVPEKEGE